MSLTELPPPPADPEFCVISRRNDSLEKHRRWIAFATLALASLGVATAFAAAGAWPVLAWSAVELTALGVAFAVIERRARVWERLTVAGDRVIVERGVGSERRVREFNRRWLQVEVSARGAKQEPRLTLRFAGEAIPFGEALSPGRRTEIAKTLRRLTAA
jgi:uncharacterized membrane protein